MQGRRAPKRLSAGELWEFALKALNARPYAAAELRRKLSARAESPEALKTTMEKLREYQLVDDSRYAEVFAVSRLENQGFGPPRVLRDLRSKSIPAATAEKAVQGAYSGVEEEDLAARFLERKYRAKNLALFLSEEKNLLAAFRRLRTAGFAPSVSIRVLKRFAARVEELEHAAEEPDGNEEA